MSELVQQDLQQSEQQWSVLAPGSIQSKNGATLTVLEDHSLLAGGKIPAFDTYVVETAAIPPGTSGLRLEVLTHESLPRKGPGWAGNGNFVLDEVTVEMAQ